MNLQDYLSEFKPKPCPYCGARTIRPFDRRGNLRRPFENRDAFKYSYGSCRKCGVKLDTAKYIILDFSVVILWWIIFLVLLNNILLVRIWCVCGIVLVLLRYFVLIPFTPIDYVADYKHPKLGAPDDWREPKRYTDADIENYKIFGNFVFSMIDSGLINVGYKSENYDFASLCGSSLKEIIDKNKYSMNLIVLDTDVIFFQTSVCKDVYCGVAVTRNGIDPKASEADPKFEKHLFFNRMKGNVYYFQGETRK